MSRSYRHHFMFPTEGDRKMKKIFNRKVRHQADLPNYGGYKRVCNSGDIKDWIYIYLDEEDFVLQNLGYGDDEKTLRKIFRRHYLSK